MCIQFNIKEDNDIQTSSQANENAHYCTFHVVCYYKMFRTPYVHIILYNAEIQHITSVSWSRIEKFLFVLVLIVPNVSAKIQIQQLSLNK